ncbi:hypothetical protein HHX47_DHR1001978 [Lentinula edodes]|nr:hypothetical protein HHX47_DHR1001978 [Lentinula edodes]
MAAIAVARAYQASFQSRPHTTLAVTGGTFNALGDFVAQTYQNTLSLFLGSMGVMERRTMPQIKQKFFDLYTPALITNWQVWPIAQLINFRFMPLPYRVPFQSTCGVFWTLYLSIINSKEDMKQDREVELHKTLIQ